jgi:putative phosphoribosyl transferase
MTRHIISTSSEQFIDREEAGSLLAEELSRFDGRRTVVLGIPRGGIVVASALTKKLGGELDIIISRKLRTPGYPELAMGSVSEDGRVFLNEQVVREVGISRQEIEQEKERQMAEIKRRSEMIRSVAPKIPLEGRMVIVTDDGVATGATFQSALRSARTAEPAKLIAAIPVGSEESIARLAREADELVCLRVPRYFAAVGQFYMHFEAVEDEDVVKILKEARERVRAR